MKNIIITVILMLPLIAKAVEINNLTIKNITPDMVEIYKNDKHIFSSDCRATASCNIYTTDIESPKYTLFDGEIQTNSHIKNLSISNIKTFKPFYWTNNQHIQFIVSSASPNGSYSSVKFFLIDTTTGTVRVDTTESDWYKFGLSKPIN
jgi:hypothetical protein